LTNVQTQSATDSKAKREYVRFVLLLVARFNKKTKKEVIK
jgi:hypothetical protein